MLLEFINNLAILLSLSMIYSFLSKYISSSTNLRKIATGILLGMIAIIGMLNPINISSGILLDGMLVIISVAGAFFSPVIVVLASVIASGYRIWFGSAGAVTGVIVIFTSAGLDRIFCDLKKSKFNTKVYIFSVNLEHEKPACASE